MIIWGSRRAVHRVATLSLFCRRCNGTYAATVNKSVTRLTLFFIPLFPIGARHAVTCTSCGVTDLLGAEEARRLVQQHANPQVPAQQQGYPQAFLPQGYPRDRPPRQQDYPVQPPMPPQQTGYSGPRPPRA